MPGAALADVYVRHAMPAASADQPSASWRLSDAGQAAAEALASRLAGRTDLPKVATVTTSPEPKAVGTAEPLAARLGLVLRVDDRLEEAHRPWVGEDYRVVVHRYLGGEAIEGWEPRAAVAARVGAAVAEARAASPDGGAVVVGHGLALCLHLASGLPAGFDPAAFWARLAFPDAWVVDRDDLVLRRAA